MQEGNKYSLVIKSKLSTSKVLGLFKLFESSTKIDFLYSDGKDRYYEVWVPKDGIFATEMLSEIESGNIPEKFLAVEIVKPEVFSINSLNGENLDLTWGVKKYNPASYLDELKAKTLTKNFSPLKVGIIDTGIDYNHPDLKGRVLKGYDFVNNDSDAYDDQGHGTHISGTIGANLNGNGIVGVNPYVEFVPLKICNSRGFCPSYAVIKALEYSKNNRLDILNMSLGGRGDPNDNPICDGIKSAVDSGIIVVSASGNSNVDTSTFVPAGCNSAITVAAIDENNSRASFSNYGSKVDVAAPGVGVYSTFPINKGSYRKLSGTSMATPHIVGLISVMKTFNPTLNSSEIKSLLKQYSLGVNGNGKYIASGVDIKSLLGNLKTEKEDFIKEESVLDEENDKNLEKKEEIKNIYDESILVDNIELIENQEDLDNKVKQSNLELEQELLDSEIIEKEIAKEIIKINLFGEEGLETNSKDEILYDIFDLNPELIKHEIKEYFEVQNFNENGKIEGSIEINSNNSEENIFGKKEEVVEELLIDGAEKGIEINNFGNESFSNLELKEYNELENYQDEFSGTGEEIKEIVEKIENKELKKELLIDGAEKGIEINNFGEENLEEIKFSSLEDLANEFYEDSLSGAIDLGEKNNEIEIKEESLSDNYKTELIIDGAEKGLEINNFDNSYIGERIETTDIRGYKEYEYKEELSKEELEEMQDFEETLDYGYGIYKEIDEEFLEEIYIPEGTVELSDDKNLSENEISEINPSSEIIKEENDETGSIGIQNTVYCNIKVGENCNYRFYKARRYKQVHTVRDIARLYASKRRISIKGESPGVTEIKFYDYKNSNFFTIYVNIEAYPVVEKEVFVGDIYESEKIRRAYRYDYKLSDSSFGDLRKNYRNYTIKTKKVGILYIDDNYQKKRFRINIKEKPKPKEYNINIEQGKYTNFYFPNKSNYRFYYELVDGATVSLYSYNGYVRLYGRNYGKLKYKVYHGNNHLYTLNIEVNPKITHKNYEIYNGKSLSVRVYNGEYSIENKAKINFSSYSRGYSLRAKEAGEVKIYIKNKGYHLETHTINIKEIPKPKVYDLTIQDGDYSKMYLPNDSSYYYRFGVNNLDSGRISAYSGRGYLNIGGNNVGNVELKVYNGSNYIHLYTINIKIVPEPPKIIEASIYEGKRKYFSLSNYRYGNVTVSETGLARLSSNNYGIHVMTEKAGYLEIYLKDRYGKHKYTIKLNILEIPKVQEYNLDINVGSSAKIYLPEDISKYKITGDSLGVFDNRNLGAYKNSFNFKTERVGQATIYLNDKEGYRWLKYKINVNVKAIERNIVLNHTYYLEIYHNENYDYISENNNIARQKGYSYRYYDDSRKEYEALYGVNPGKTKIELIHHKYGLKEIWNVEVKEKPEIRELHCETQVGDECNFLIKNSDYIIETQVDRKYLEVDASKSRFEIESEVSGEIIVYLKSFSGDYYTHKLNVKVNPKAPKIKTCDIVPGSICEIGSFYSIDGRYDFKYSKDGIVDLKLYRESLRTNYKSKLKIYGLKPGELEIYVYKDKDLVAIIKTNVLKIDEISLDDTFIKVDQGEIHDGKILSGGGDYKVERDGVEYFSIDKNKDSDGNYLQKVDFGVKTSKAGKYYPIVKDQYNQTKTLKVLVKDVSLILGDYNIKLKTGEKYLIPVYEKYQYISKLEKASQVKDSISAKKHKGTRGDDYIQIEAHKAGLTILRVTDAEGNTRIVSIEVVGNGFVEKEEDEESSKGNNEDLSNSEKELIEEINKLFTEFGVDISSVDEGVEVNSIKEAFRCELGRTGKYWSKPYNATCVDNNTYIAWKCSQGYVDVFNIDGTNTCIKKEYVNILGELKLKRNKYRDFVSKVSTSNSQKLVYKILKLYYKDDKISKIKNEKSKAIVTYILDDILNELDKKSSSQLKDFQDLSFFFKKLKSSNIGNSSNNNYEINYITKKEFDDLAGIVAKKLFNYKLNYDSNYKNNYNKELNRQLGNGGDKEQIEEGIKEGIIEGTKDYIVSYYDLVKSLKDLSLSGLSSGLDKAWGFISNPIENTKNAVEFVKTETKKLYDKLLVLTGYELAKGSSYVGTTLGLSAADPTGKVFALAGGKFFGDISKKVDELISHKVIKDVKTKVAGTIDHIMEVKFKEDGTFGGVHSYKAILNHNFGARIEIDSRNKLRKDNDEPYEAKVFANNDNGVEVIKVSPGKSTFFPDSWNKEKIMREVEFAIQNNKGQKFPGSIGNKANIYRGPSIDGEIEILFAYKNGVLFTFYPLLK